MQFAFITKVILFLYSLEFGRNILKFYNESLVCFEEGELHDIY